MTLIIPRMRERKRERERERERERGRKGGTLGGREEVCQIQPQKIEPPFFMCPCILIFLSFFKGKSAGNVEA